MNIVSIDSLGSNSSSVYGFAALAGLSVAFGVAYLPMKRYDMGNGMFSQWIVCISISICALFFQLIAGSTQLKAIAMLSGVLFATGNMCSVFIIKRLGVGMGVLLWSTVNLLFGWASSRFGWFSIKPQVPKNVAMNYAGVILAAISTVLYIFIKPQSAIDQDSGELSSDHFDTSSEYEPLLEQVSRQERNRCSKFDRILGVLLAILSGACYGCVFVPIIYVQENDTTASQRGIDYIASTGIGALVASSVYFILYAIFSLNLPILPSVQIILPAMLTGLLWCTGQLCWLIANDALKASITFPIATSMPAAIVALIGTLFYREVQGCRNYILLSLALVLTSTGAILTGFSK